MVISTGILSHTYSMIMVCVDGYIFLKKNMIVVRDGYDGPQLIGPIPTYWNHINHLS